MTNLVLDIMCSKLEIISLQLKSKEYANLSCISAGSTVTAAVTENGELYMWGSGIGQSSRIPSQINVKILRYNVLSYILLSFLVL